MITTANKIINRPDDADALGSLIGYLYVAPHDLAKHIGEPSSEDSGDGKVSRCYTVGEATGPTVYLYDWKATSIYDLDCPSPDEWWAQRVPCHVHVGGYTENWPLAEQLAIELNAAGIKAAARRDR